MSIQSHATGAEIDEPEQDKGRVEKDITKEGDEING